MHLYSRNYLKVEKDKGGKQLISTTGLNVTL